MLPDIDADDRDVRDQRVLVSGRSHLESLVRLAVAL